MFSALVGDRKDIELQNLCINFHSWNVLYLHSSFYRRPFSCLKRTCWWDDVKERQEVKGETGY